MFLFDALTAFAPVCTIGTISHSHLCAVVSEGHFGVHNYLGFQRGQCISPSFRFSHLPFTTLQVRKFRVGMALVF
jgi:hypothetical protein